MESSVHPLDLEGLGAVGDLKRGFCAHSVLNERNRFDENVVVSEESFLSLQQSREESPGGRVVRIAGVGESVERRRVDEYQSRRSARIASARASS